MQKIGAIPVILISGYKQLEVGHLANLTQAKAWIVPERYRKIDYTSFMGDVRKASPQLKNIIFVRSENKAGGDAINFESLLDRDVTSKDRNRLELAKPCRPMSATSFPRAGQRAFRRASRGHTTTTYATWNTSIKAGR
jgi:acyl-coenzyme A synthetase/AMP-(fatty) acid ligase